MIKCDVEPEIQVSNKKRIESNLLSYIINIGKLSNASTFYSTNAKESEETKKNYNISSSNNNSNIEALVKKASKIRNENNSGLYSQDFDILNFMKIKPPKLPNIYDHDYDLQNSNKKPKNEAYDEIDKGKIPVIFLGHLMTGKKKSLNKTCITQRNKKKLLTIIYYTS